jgi:uncharacterized protein with von Willebrand factor type A (vWA) domain
VSSAPAASSLAPAAPGLVSRTVGLVEALREAGLSVSVAETVDAVRALAAVELIDREGLRAALAASTVKSAGPRATFDALFDLWFPPTLGPGTSETSEGTGPGDQPSPDQPGEASADGQPAGAPRAGSSTGQPDLTDAEPELTEAQRRALRQAMREELAALLRADDRVGQRRLARRAVDQLGRAPAAGGQVSYSAMKTLGELSPETLLAALAAALRGDAPVGGMADAVARRTALGRLATFDRFVRDEATLRLSEA